MMGKIANNATSSIDIDNIAISNNQPTNMQMPIFDNIPLSNETRRENDTDNDSETSESQSIDITSININIHDSRGCDLRSTSKANISTTMVKQNNSLAIDTDTVNISTTNATLNNQVDVDNIVTRIKSNKRIYILNVLNLLPLI